MKNILFFVPTLSNGGAEKTVANISKILNEKYSDKYKINVCVMYDEVMYQYGGNLIVLSNKINSNMGTIEKIKTKLKQIKELKQIKKELHIDVSISFLFGADLVNVFSRVDEKIVISIRNKESFFCNTLISRWKRRFICMKAHHIVAISKIVELDLIETFKIEKNKISTIYNPAPIYTSFEMEVNEEFCYALLNKKDIVITAGRISHQKGQWHLIRSFKQVVEKNPNAVLFVLGKGELEEYLMKLVKELNLDEYVYFIGFVKYPHVYIHKSNVFVFPSLVEGLGNVLLETMCCKTAIISSDCKAGPRELLAPTTNLNTQIKDIEYAEYGILIPTCNGVHSSAKVPLSREEKIMAEAINEILTNDMKQIYYSKAAKRRSNDFSSENIGKQWDDLISSIVLMKT